MPIYQYQCPVCGNRSEAHRPVADRGRSPRCHGPMERHIFTAPVTTYTPFEGYKCLATGETVTSERQRKSLMAEHGLVDSREVAPPDFQKMEQEVKEVHESANAPLPAELTAAMKREGLDNLL